MQKNKLIFLLALLLTPSLVHADPSSPGALDGLLPAFFTILVSIINFICLFIKFKSRQNNMALLIFQLMLIVAALGWLIEFETTHFPPFRRWEPEQVSFLKLHSAIYLAAIIAGILKVIYSPKLPDARRQGPDSGR